MTGQAAQAGDVSILSRPERRLQPAMRGRLFALRWSFNPQPPRKTAATRHAAVHRTAETVSILSRPERRLQPFSAWRCSSPAFQSSAAPKDGCNHRAGSQGHEYARFNPQPPRKTAATRRAARAKRMHARFNPQPPRKTAATGGDAELRTAVTVSILSRPERRLQPCSSARGSAPGSFNPQPPRKTAATVHRLDVSWTVPRTHFARTPPALSSF